MGPSPYGGPESDTTEQLSTTQIHFTGRDLNLRGRDAFFSLFFFWWWRVEGVEHSLQDLSSPARD